MLIDLRVHKIKALVKPKLSRRGSERQKSFFKPSLDHCHLIRRPLYAELNILRKFSHLQKLEAFEEPARIHSVVTSTLG
jgi:hypothetical protein